MNIFGGKIISGTPLVFSGEESVWLSESGTFYRSFQFPLHGNYQLVFSRLPTTKKLLKRNFQTKEIL